MSLCKPSSFAENNPTLQHANKQEKMLLDKKVQFMHRQEKQTKAFVSTDQQLVLRRMKTNLNRSVIASKKIAKLRSNTSAENSLKSDLSQDLRTAWSDNNPLSSEAVPSISTQEALPASVSLPAAVCILQSQGRKINPTILRKVENLEQTATNPNLLSVPKKFNSTQLPVAGNKHRRGSAASTNSSGSFRLIKKRPKRQQVAPATIHVRPSSAPKAPTVIAGNKEFATAMWVASQEHGSTRLPAVKCRPLSAKPSMGSTSKRDKTDVAQNQENEEGSLGGVVVLVTPPDSPNLSDLRIYEEALTTQSLDDLLKKLNEANPEISLVDLHRATVATKNYPERIKQFLRKIYKYKSPTAVISVDYYAYRLNATKTK